MGSQYLWYQGSRPKHVSNPDSVTKKSKPHFIHDCFLPFCQVGSKFEPCYIYSWLSVVLGYPVNLCLSLIAQVDSKFETCKICHVNDKDYKIEPCGQPITHCINQNTLYQHLDSRCVFFGYFYRPKHASNPAYRSQRPLVLLHAHASRTRTRLANRCGHVRSCAMYNSHCMYACVSGRLLCLPCLPLYAWVSGLTNVLASVHCRPPPVPHVL